MNECVACSHNPLPPLPTMLDLNLYFPPVVQTAHSESFSLSFKSTVTPGGACSQHVELEKLLSDKTFHLRLIRHRNIVIFTHACMQEQWLSIHWAKWAIMFPDGVLSVYKT